MRPVVYGCLLSARALRGVDRVRRLGRFAPPGVGGGVHPCVPPTTCIDFDGRGWAGGPCGACLSDAFFWTRTRPPRSTGRREPPHLRCAHGQGGRPGGKSLSRA